MKKTFKDQLICRLNLYKDLTNIKLSLLWFSTWSRLDPSVAQPLIRSVIDRFEKISITRGRMAAIDEFKISRLAFTRWLCKRPLHGHVGAPITKIGLPKVIPKEIRSMLIRTPNDDLIKAVITVLNIGRYFKGGKPVNIEDIIQPSDPKLPKDPEIILGLKKLGIEVGQDRPTKWRFSWITTAGPNGPSISSCLQDLQKFNERFRPQAVIMLPDLTAVIDRIISWETKFKLTKLMSLDKFKNDSLRKLSVKDDREGKSRIFAIFDYWSQTLLSPLHDWAFSTLRKIPQDCTFDQSAGVKKILATKSNKYFYSYDLKAATDRFPVIFQKNVLSLIFDTDYATAWTEVMTSEPFRLKGFDQPIKWMAGQPLGAKSSWGIFTLCHHLVVHIAAIRTNSEPLYVILGDDIVLRGHALAAEYKRIMSDLGVDISETKSHVSQDTFEFAKIWMHQGRNLSGFPIVGIAETLTKPLELAALLVFELPRKGYLYHVDPRTVSQFISPIALWNTLPQRQAVYIADKVVWYFSFLSWLATKDSGWAKYIVQSASLVTSPLNADKLFSQIISVKWRSTIEERLWNFQEFGFDIFAKIGKLPPFKNFWDPKAYPGKMTGSSIEFNEPARNIPIFAALQDEANYKYEEFLQKRLEDEDHHLTLEEIASLKLPPKPQMKGFDPVRGKENIRTLDLITRNIKSLIMTQGLEIKEDVYSLK